ncbi:MAG TPA: hypothetical protein VI356_06995 [Myxococcales bacterium]
MTDFTLWRFPMLALAVVSLSGCFDDSSYLPFVDRVADRNSLAIINGPHTVDIGSTSVEVTGAFFSSDSVVYWNGKPQATIFKGSGDLEFTPDPGLTDDDGSAQVKIGTAAGPFSNTVTAIVEQNSVSVTSVSPTFANPGDGPITLTVNGVGFVSGAQVLWNGASLTTTRVNGHQLTADIPAALLANAGNALVRVEVPCCARILIPFRTVVPFQVGQSKIVTVTDGSVFRNAVSALDLAGDATSGNIYGVQDSFFNGELLTIDPQAAVATPTVIPSADLVRLAISDQHQFLYVIHNAFSNVPATRYTLPGFTDATAVGGVGTDDVVPAPGLPSTAALLLHTGAIAIVDGTSLRPNQASNVNPVNILGSVAWGFDSSTLYVVTSFGQVQRYAVDASGIGGSSPTLVSSAQRGTLFYDRTLRRLYGTGGSNLDEQGNSHGSFALPADAFHQSVCPVGVADGAIGKVFFACQEDQVGVTIRAYDADTSATLGMVTLGGQLREVPSRIVRWGTNGLAVAAGSAIFLYSGALVR